ncbi:MAG: hypothetical protein ABI878_04375 [Acidobacteriota bacterium]
MGFRVFAAGTDHFHYERDGFPDGDTFEPMKVVSTLMTMEPNGFGVAGAAIDHYTPGITDLMESMATIEFLHNLNNAVCFLAMCTGASDGWISVSSRHTHALWPDTMGFAHYAFSPGDNPGAEFIRLIAPGLKETGMNNWGTLAALGMVLARYSNQIGEDARPIINFQLTK